ncbi:hypothetical protein BDV27DRAFT_164063 [Aspergillus caelatus]|uniref:Beta/gamma crystallin 'Greek key' domain-containing protein n=1 Tax=Aspergillus caelatus TaxID=61420 RepID=A0A5N6ZJW7_9EURO|nr:uncharacterized protein BDV27DRAFT_164063 [Aspergillus caelatus]KAE8357921.1 hypothetical protein BDV27DRAFT_164063 [Aspergillus caelatus]
MFNFGTVFVTTLGLLMAGVASGAPAEPASMMDNPAATVYQDMEYKGNSLQLLQANLCYSFPENTPWFHNISSMNIRPGYICDAYMGFGSNQMLKEGMQGEHLKLDDDNINNMIESMKCRPM